MESEHKQSIHKIIIGHEGVQISTDLTNAKAVEKNLKQSFEECKKELDAKNKSIDRRDYLTISDSEEPAVIAELKKWKTSYRLVGKKMSYLN